MNSIPGYISDLATMNVGDVCVSEPLCDHSTWSIGGPADALVEPHDTADLVTLLRYLKTNHINTVVIGGGSNLLFDDTGFRGVIVKIGNNMSALEIDGTAVTAQAGISTPRLARAAGSAGLSGIEHTVGIPGTFGGLLVMNGGSLRKNIGDVIRQVNVIDRSGNERTLAAEDCNFSYRWSVFQQSDDIVVSGTMDLKRSEPAAIRSEMLDILHTRQAMFPLTQPSCGSVFSSSREMFDSVGPPGRLIEEAGLKGTQAGGAQISDVHANFIVNTGTATAGDVRRLIRIAREAVHKRTGYWMTCEVKILPAEGQPQPAHELIDKE